ncbi:MAG: hypothetical protein JWR38_2929 [Mucilaginibacter sp.]|nr:hypothetical protein [Mucilaginibacter sp.]
MLLQKKQTAAPSQQRAQVLRTEGPLCEKDEQALAIERAKLLQKEALEKWQRLKRDR